MSEAKYLPVAMKAAAAQGLDPVMFAGQIAQESGWNPTAKSSAGALGIAQFMPATAKGLKVDPLDPVAAINKAAEYMATLKKRFGTEDLARLAYNWGEGNVSKYLAKGGKGTVPEEAANYNAAIAKRAAKYGEVVAQAETPAPAAQKPARQAPSENLNLGLPATKVASSEDAARQALAEMNQGLPPGGLAQPVLQETPAWAQTLAGMGSGMQATPMAALDGGDQLDMLQQLTDAASRNQDAAMASMFGDVLPAKREDTSMLPASVDRYLDRILS